MRKKISILVILLLLTIYTINVQAATTTSSFISDTTTIKAGDTVKITLSLSNSSRINAITTSLKFDSNVFEYQSATLQDTTNYSLLSSSADDIVVIAITEEGSTVLNLDITLKVKENLNIEETTVSTADIVVDQLNEDDKETLSSRTLSFTVEKNEESLNNKEDNTTQENTAENAPTSTNNTTKLDNTTKESSIPYTGQKGIMAIIAVVSIISIICYIKYKKYKSI